MQAPDAFPTNAFAAGRWRVDDLNPWTFGHQVQSPQ